MGRESRTDRYTFWLTEFGLRWAKRVQDDLLKRMPAMSLRHAQLSAATPKRTREEEPEPASPAKQKKSEEFFDVSVAPGTQVILHGLKDAPHRNGTKGKVRTFDAGKGRYSVDVGDRSGLLSLRPLNLTQLCSAEVFDLKTRSELNGSAVDILNFDDASGRYIVRLPQCSEEIALRPGNIALKEGMSVVLSGLVGSEELNGCVFRLTGCDKGRSRY